MPTYRAAVRLDYPGDGGPGFNSFHFRSPGGDNLGTGTGGAAAALRSFYGEILGSLAPLVRVSFDGHWSEVGSGGDGIEVGGWVQERSTGSQVLPEFVAGLLSWRTARAGRTGRGRTFLSPLDRSVIENNGNLREEVRDTIVSAARSTLITPFASAGNGAFGVYSRTANVISDFSSVSMGLEFASLTSRRD